SRCPARWARSAEEMRRHQDHRRSHERRKQHADTDISPRASRRSRRRAARVGVRDWYKRKFGYRDIGTLKKLHEFGHPAIDFWTTLEADIERWYRESYITAPGAR